MQKPYIKILGIVVILSALFVILSSWRASKKYNFNTEAKTVYKLLQERNHYITPDQAIKIIDQNDPEYVLVDLRNPRQFANFHVGNAVNVPLQAVLDNQYHQIFNDKRKKVLYSDECIEANQVWILLTQFGYQNLFVLEGGADFWKNHVLDKNVFKADAIYQDEKPKYDFKKVSEEVGMAPANSNSEEATPALPTVPAKRKKMVAGGCS